MSGMQRESNTTLSLVSRSFTYSRYTAISDILYSGKLIAFRRHYIFIALQLQVEIILNSYLKDEFQADNAYIL